MVLEAVQKLEIEDDTVLSLLTCSPAMVVWTLRYVLLNAALKKLDVAIVKHLVNTGKDKVEIKPNTILSVCDVMCSRYQTVTTDGQLEVVKRTLSSLESVSVARRHYLEDRSSLLSGGDWIHSYRGCDVDDLCGVLEMEMSVTIPGADKPTLVQSIMSVLDDVLN